jgi:hypothetical protein
LPTFGNRRHYKQRLHSVKLLVRMTVKLMPVAERMKNVLLPHMMLLRPGEGLLGMTLSERLRPLCAFSELLHGQINA